jgi:hypothetical protein
MIGASVNAASNSSVALSAPGASVANADSRSGSPKFLDAGVNEEEEEEVSPAG